jgi:hypothetical protein
MQQSLLDRLVELIKRDYPGEWETLCYHAHADDPSVLPEDVARRFLRGFRRKRDGEPMASVETDWLCWNCIELFADAFRNQMSGRKKGTLERIPLGPDLITAETLRFYPDELVLDGGELIIVDVRIEPVDLSGALINKLMGKEWISAALERRRNELSRLPITKAGGALADESKTAPNCRKPLTKGYCTNELRKSGIWKPQSRHSPKQSP